MKLKQFPKKISLSKETVANLSIDQMRNSNGGALWTDGCITGIVCDTDQTCYRNCVFSLQDYCTFEC